MTGIRDMLGPFAPFLEPVMAQMGRDSACQADAAIRSMILTISRFDPQIAERAAVATMAGLVIEMARAIMTLVSQRCPTEAKQLRQIMLEEMIQALSADGAEGAS